jgi:hypothetical protein
MDTTKETPVEGFGVYSAPENTAPKTEESTEQLRSKYKAMDGKIYEIVTSIQEDDENEKEFDFIFRKPGTPSYDRYVKTSGTSGTKALKTFVLDNICDEQRTELKDALEEYPAMAISLGEKLLNMLGLSKETTVKKL